MDKELIENFIMHPDWSKMQEYILNHFESETDVKTIDVSNDSSVIHAEVIARQRISNDIDSLKASFESLKRQGKKNKITYE